MVSDEATTDRGPAFSGLHTTRGQRVGADLEQMNTLVQPRVALAIANLRAAQWQIRRLGPYSCVLGFILIGSAALALSRAVLIGWQWDRVDVTDSLWSMLLQGLRSDLITLGLFAAPSVVVLPLFLAANRLSWWSRLSSAWLSVSLIAILLLEFATPQFLYEYDSRPNRLFVEYLVPPRSLGHVVDRL